MANQKIQALLSALKNEGFILRSHPLQAEMLNNLVRPIFLAANQSLDWESVRPATLCFVESGQVQRGIFLFQNGDVFYPEQFNVTPGPVVAQENSCLFLLSDWALNVIQNTDPHSRQLTRLERDCLQLAQAMPKPRKGRAYGA